MAEQYFHDGRQLVNLLTGMHETDFLDRLRLDGSFLFDELFDLIWAATSAACFASSPENVTCLVG